MGVSVGSSIYNAPSIYESGAGGGGGGGGEGLPIGEVINFPSGYTPLESIEFKNRLNEGIKIPFTGYRSSFNTTANNVEIKLKITNTNINSQLIRFLPGGSSDELIYKYLSGTRYFMKYSNGQPKITFYNISFDIITEKFTLIDTYNKLTINGSVETIPSFTTVNTRTDFIFGSAPNTSVLGPNAILYSLIIKDPNLNAVFIGVPAFDEANEIDGLLDIVTNEFFPHYWDS